MKKRLCSIVNISFFLFSLRALSCIKDLQSRPYIKIKTYRKAKKAWDCNMKKLCHSLHKVAGAVRKPNVSQRGINKKSWKTELRLCDG